MTNDDMTIFTQDERDTIEATIAKLINSRRAKGGQRGLTLTREELLAAAALAQDLAAERVRKTTGTKTYRVHFHEGKATTFERVHEKSEKRRLT